MGQQVQRYYRDIKRIKKGYGASLWSQERCLHALHLWHEEEQHFPHEQELRNSNGLPGYWTIKKYFKTLPKYIEAYEAWIVAKGIPLPRLERGTIEEDPPDDLSSDGIRRPCIRCGKLWDSPDRRNRWICATCTYTRLHNSDELDTDGAWMTGEPIRRMSVMSIEDLMDIATIA